MWKNLKHFLFELLVGKLGLAVSGGLWEIGRLIEPYTLAKVYIRQLFTIAWAAVFDRLVVPPVIVNLVAALIVGNFFLLILIGLECLWGFGISEAVEQLVVAAITNIRNCSSYQGEGSFQGTVRS